MHEKGYSIDGKWLREGSANWSPGAERMQDNCIPDVESHFESRCAVERRIG
jgi:hypothetical protein